MKNLIPVGQMSIVQTNLSPAIPFGCSRRVPRKSAYFGEKCAQCMQKRPRLNRTSLSGRFEPMTSGSGGR